MYLYIFSCTRYYAVQILKFNPPFLKKVFHLFGRKVHDLLPGIIFYCYSKGLSFSYLGVLNMNFTIFVPAERVQRRDYEMGPAPFVSSCICARESVFLHYADCTCCIHHVDDFFCAFCIPLYNDFVRKLRSSSWIGTFSILCMYVDQVFPYHDDYVYSSTMMNCWWKLMFKKVNKVLAQIWEK